MSDAKSDASAADRPPGGDAVELTPGVFLPAAALEFSFVRSSGPGGQHVNKRSTKARLTVSIDDLREVMSQTALARLKRLAGPSRLTQDNHITLTEAGSRSQYMNRQACIERLGELVQRALRPPRPRKKTRPTKASRTRRIETKKRRSQVKNMRRRPRSSDDSS